MKEEKREGKEKRESLCFCYVFFYCHFFCGKKNEKKEEEKKKHLVDIIHPPRFFAEKRMNRLFLQRLKSTSPAAEHIPRSSASVHQR